MAPPIVSWEAARFAALPTKPESSPAAATQPSVEHLYQFGEYAITKLYNKPAEEISKYELAEMNLISAYGLPGTRKMDMGAMLSLLDAWVQGAAKYTAKSVGYFARNKFKFDGSLARFRITAMVQFLTRQCGVRYNPDRVTDPDNFDDPEDSFIHGLLGPRRVGTCASLPVLLTAMGRKLGYPLKLVHVPSHCFCRWDSPQERFNIEYHEEGMNSHPDEFYKEWPLKWTSQVHEQERKRPVFLQSLTPQQDLAYFAQVRASQLDIAGGRRREAMKAMHVAYRLWPTHGYCVWLTHLTTKALFPDKDFPHLPCAETAGREICQQLVREGKVVVMPPLDPRAQ